MTLDALARVQEKSATLEEVNDELQRKNEKLRGKLDAQVTKYRDLEGVYVELQECICGLED